MPHTREYPGAFTEERYDPAPGSSKAPRFRLKPFEGVTMSTAPSYLVKGILPRIGLTIVWGPPKCGKSFWTFDLVMHVALGWQYRGRRVQQGPVVYLALEGGHGFATRVEAWRRQHLNGHRSRVPFFLCDEPIDLVRDHGKLITTIRAQLGEQVPAVVVIDTLNRALIGDENKSDDMAKFIRAADVIRVTFGCLVIIIHHCGIAGGRPRGHSSLSGADDAQIAIERDKDSGIVIAQVEHMKDGDASAPMASRLERVELGADDDGDPINSCVIVPAELPSKGPKLSGATKLAFDSLVAALAETGEVPPASNHIPPGHLACSAVLWREYFYRLYVGKPDTKQKAFVRAATRLQEHHLIGIWSDKAWVAGHARHRPDIGQMSGERSRPDRPD